MRTILTAVTMCLAFAPNLGIGATIHEDVFSVNRFGHSGPSNEFFVEIGVTFSYVELAVLEKRQAGIYDIQVVNQTADAPKLWNLVEPGDVLSKGTIRSGEFPALLAGSTKPKLTVGEDFYIGIGYEDGSSLDEDGNLGILPIFGWAHFRITDGALTVVDSVLTLDSPGIIVGTTTLAPEPSSLTMIGMPMLVLAALRRRK